MRENLKSIYVLLFLTVAFFFLQMQDPERYVSLFALHRQGVAGGELWRLFTFQFLAGSPFWLFFELLILWIMGSAVEEELGTARFLTFFLLANFVTAGIGLLLGVPLLGSYFSGLALLFAFAMRFPEHVFYLFFILPVKVKWLALVVLGISAFTALQGSAAMISALAGAGVGVGYVALMLRMGLPVRRRIRPHVRPVPPENADGSIAEKNQESFRRTQAAAAAGGSAATEELDRLAANVTPGVNICPPSDFKPEGEDRYCLRCEGFAECSGRWLRARTASEDQSPESSRGAAESGR